jgi:hypothetical protein
METVKESSNLLLSSLEDGIDMVITEFTILESRNSRFANYLGMCRYIENSIKRNNLGDALYYLERIIKRTNEVFYFGNHMAYYVFSFFGNKRYMDHYTLITLTMDVYGGYVHKKN